MSLVLWPVPTSGTLHLPVMLGSVCTSLRVNKLIRLYEEFFI